MYHAARRVGISGCQDRGSSDILSDIFDHRSITSYRGITISLRSPDKTEGIVVIHHHSSMIRVHPTGTKTLRSAGEKNIRDSYAAAYGRALVTFPIDLPQFLPAYLYISIARLYAPISRLLSPPRIVVPIVYARFELRVAMK